MATAGLNPGTANAGKLIVEDVNGGHSNTIEITGSGLVTGSTITFASTFSGDSFPGTCVASLNSSKLVGLFQCRRVGSSGAVTITVTIQPPMGMASTTTIANVAALVIDDGNGT